jgi:hypothetical protein
MAGDYQGTGLVFLVLWASWSESERPRAWAGQVFNHQKLAGVWPVGPVLYLAAKKKRGHRATESALIHDTRIIFLNEVKQIDCICTMSDGEMNPPTKKKAGIR